MSVGQEMIKNISLYMQGNSIKKNERKTFGNTEM